MTPNTWPPCPEAEARRRAAMGAPPKAPDPSNCPQTPDSGLIATLDEKGRLQSVAREPDALARLEAWRYGHKNRSVSIMIDDGYGATCWEVELTAGKESVLVTEASIMEPRSDWPGLAATIHAAIDKAEEAGL